MEAAVDLHIYNQFINLYSILPDYLLLGATGHGQLQLAALLLKRGANVNANNYGETALQLAVYAAELNGPQMIEFLVAAGAQPVLGSADAFRTLLLLRSHQHHPQPHCALYCPVSPVWHCSTKPVSFADHGSSAAIVGAKTDDFILVITVFTTLNLVYGWPESTDYACLQHSTGDFFALQSLI